MDDLRAGTDGQEARVGAGAAAADEGDGTGVDAAQHTQELLAEHVPLTLLVDLLSPTRQTSADIMAAEGLPEQEWWADPDGGTP